MSQVALKYDYAFDLNSDHAGAHVLRLVRQNSRVLEIGAGPGSITKPLKFVNGCRISALEIEPAAVANLKTFCEDVISADLNDHTWPAQHFAEEKFDYVVIADVLEHLVDPVGTLKAASQCLNSSGAIVVSIPHVANNAIIACLVTGNFEYRDWGLLDRTHLRFFAIENVKQLAHDAGLKITDARFVLKSPKKTEFSGRWKQLPLHLRLALAANKFGNIYQVVFKAEPQGSPTREFDLLSAARKASASK
jgi:2-polyprenyl-3-methyl-5-hydroxy-6-metoxy-1,4-benzoquinol methylase